MGEPMTCCSFMPSFHHSVAVLLFRSYRCRCSCQLRTEMLETSFPIHRDEVTRTLIGCPPTAERQKIGFDPICYGTAVLLRHNGRWKRQRRNGFLSRKQRIERRPNSCGALHNSYGIYVTATAKRQRQNGNGMVETRHYVQCCAKRSVGLSRL